MIERSANVQVTAHGEEHLPPDDVDPRHWPSSLMTLSEAAVFLRRSRSWVYQNLSVVPHHTVPGMRGHWFDRTELLTWVKSGGTMNATQQGPILANRDTPATDLASGRSTIYHRNPLYK
jgi:hypothetical protein